MPLLLKRFGWGDSLPVTTDAIALVLRILGAFEFHHLLVAKVSYVP